MPKKTLKKSRGTLTGKALQQFLQVYIIMPIDITPSSLPPAEVMFARKIRFVIDKLSPNKQNSDEQTLCPKNATNPERKFFFQIFRDNKSFWEMGTIEKRVGNMIYTIKVLQFTHKRILNQIRKRLSGDADSGPPEEKEVMDVIYDTFDMSILQVAPDQRRLRGKGK